MEKTIRAKVLELSDGAVGACVYVGRHKLGQVTLDLYGNEPALWGFLDDWASPEVADFIEDYEGSRWEVVSEIIASVKSAMSKN